VTAVVISAKRGKEMMCAVLLREVRGDIRKVREYDPSMSSNTQVLLTSGGMQAVWAYRISHRAWIHRHRLLAQLIRYTARFMTGVEIHPGAVIGRHLLIDHGTGVVIGETTVIGDDVIMHHQVTLGGRVNTPGKRHPTVGDRVYIGAGAMILGNVTIGSDSSVGALTLVLHDIPKKSIVVGNPARIRSK
jgi:serine O-acetyltransferase